MLEVELLIDVGMEIDPGSLQCLEPVVFHLRGVDLIIVLNRLQL